MWGAVLGAGLALATLAPPARADLPPPTGTKFVGYAFTVTGQSKHADWVVLAYPVSLSNGRPTAELAVLEDGVAQELGRRSGVPKIYAMKRADFDAWKAGYQPNIEDPFKDPAVEALLGSGKALPCDLGPSPDFTLPDSDPRDAIKEAFAVAKLDATGCHLEKPGAGGDKTDPNGATPATDPAAPPAQPRSRGCAGCTLGAEAPTWIGGLGAAVAALALARRRRRG